MGKVHGRDKSYGYIIAMRVTSLGSGSSGNALLVEAGPKRRTKLLVDAGLNGRLLIDRLRRVGVSPAQLQGVLVTHEHSDHIIGLPVLMRRYAVPVIADPRTIEAIEQSFASSVWRTDAGGTYEEHIYAQSTEPNPESVLPVVGDPVIREEISTNGMWQGNKLQHTASFSIGSRYVIGDIEVISFPVSHDAVAPCGYLLSAGGCRVCVVIDSGEVTPVMLEVMSQADLLILESNHDRQLLLRGPYPDALKQRILSSTGHLSNDQAAEAVLRTWPTDSVRWLWLSHLSRTNNTPKLALNSMRASIQAAKANLAQLHITVSPPGMGGVWDSTQLWESPSLWEIG